MLLSLKHNRPLLSPTHQSAYRTVRTTEDAIMTGGECNRKHTRLHSNQCETSSANLVKQSDGAKMSKKKGELKAEAFTIKSTVKGAVVAGPPRSGACKERPAKPTMFRKCYEYGDLPVVVNHRDDNGPIKWKVEFDSIDYHIYLPLFFNGLCEMTFPHELFARQGVQELLEAGGTKIIPVIPQLIIPIRNAMNTRNHQVMCTTLRALQQLLQSADGVGEAMVPYLKQILPIFNIFKNKNENLGDKVGRDKTIGDLINDTLQMFEVKGGPEAYKVIKYMVPTYESCMKK